MNVAIVIGEGVLESDHPECRVDVQNVMNKLLELGVRGIVEGVAELDKRRPGIFLVIGLELVGGLVLGLVRPEPGQGALPPREKISAATVTEGGKSLSRAGSIRLDGSTLGNGSRLDILPGTRRTRRARRTWWTRR